MEVCSILACVWPFVCWLDLLLICIRLNCCFQRVVIDLTNIAWVGAWVILFWVKTEPGAAFS